MTWFFSDVALKSKKQVEGACLPSDGLLFLCLALNSVKSGNMCLVTFSTQSKRVYMYQMTWYFSVLALNSSKFTYMYQVTWYFSVLALKSKKRVSHMTWFFSDVALKSKDHAYQMTLFFSSTQV